MWPLNEANMYGTNDFCMPDDYTLSSQVTFKCIFFIIKYEKRLYSR